MADVSWVARVRLPHGTLELTAVSGRLVWNALEANPQLEHQAAFATNYSNPPHYFYSPAHGFLGVKVAHDIAQELGGELELTRQDPGPSLMITGLFGDDINADVLAAFLRGELDADTLHRLGLDRYAELLKADRPPAPDEARP